MAADMTNFAALHSGGKINKAESELFIKMNAEHSC